MHESPGIRVEPFPEEIEARAAARREETGIPSLGADAVLKQDPHSRPRHSKRSPAPFCHAASRDWRQLLRTAYAEFVGAYRRAAERLMAGDRDVRFPQGSFPPPLPFVGG